MKALEILIVFASSILFYSCNKEMGRDRFEELESITLTGMQAHYSVVSGIDSLIIEPIPSSNKEAEFEYLWGIYDIRNEDPYTAMDTIGKSKKLVYPVNKAAKNWYLSLQVKNKKTGYSEYFKSTIDVATAYTRGWYVIKEENDRTDMDFFTTPNSIIADKRIENVYSFVNGEKLKGKPVMIRFFNDFKAPNDKGEYSPTRSICLVTNEDVGIMTLSGLELIKDFKTLFHGEPSKRNMQMIGNNFTNYYLINDGQLHSMIGQGPSTGTFGGRKLKDTQDTPYFLSPFHLMYTNRAFFFDETSSSFFSADVRNMNLIPVTDDADVTMSSTNNNKRMLYMGIRTTGYLSGYAIFQDKDDLSKKSIAQIIPSVSQFKIYHKTLESGEKLYKGDNFALIYQEEEVMYFSLGKEVWSRNLSNDKEKLQFTVPANEEITFIRYRKFSGSGPEADYSYNYVMVGTNDGGKYKVRMFTKSGGDLSASPAFILEGKGVAKDALFVGPAVNNLIYPFTF